MQQQKHTQVLSSIFAILLFGLYLSTGLINSFHSAFLHHQITEEVCTLEQEENTCHRAIYHNDVEEGCDHTEHFITQIVDCELCAIVLHRHTLLISIFVVDQITENSPVFSVVKQLSPTNSFSYSYPLRGPPTFS